MNLEELKQIIGQRTGIPASLLTGETIEENIAQAKALLAYKREAEAERPKSTKEQFAQWLNAQQGIEDQDTAGQALAQIEERARVEAGGYPIIQDGGSVNVQTGDPRSAKEQFSDWAGQALAYNPRKQNGWITGHF